MARNQSAWVNWSQYGVLRVAASAMQVLPIDMVLGGASDVGRLLFRFDRKHRERAMKNITRSLPELSEDEASRVAMGSMQRLLQLGVDVIFTTRLIDHCTWSSHVKFKNIDEALNLLLSDRGAIMLTGHFGNWEILGYLLTTLGIDLAAVARPIDNPLVNEWLLGVRERRGMRIITKWGATKSMTDVLSRGGTLGFIADQNAGYKGMFVPFFGRLASTYKSVGLLAIRYDVPVVCGYARRLGDEFKFEAGVTDIIYPEQWKSQKDPLYYLTARYMRSIEEMVRLAPDQYMWLHRRWKSRPRHELEGKAIPAGLRGQLESLPWMDEALMASLERGE